MRSFVRDRGCRRQRRARLAIDADFLPLLSRRARAPRAQVHNAAATGRAGFNPRAWRGVRGVVPLLEPRGSARGAIVDTHTHNENFCDLQRQKGLAGDLIYDAFFKL